MIWCFMWCNFGIYNVFVQAKVTPAVALISRPPMSSPITTSIVSLVVVIGPVKTLAGIFYLPHHASPSALSLIYQNTETACFRKQSTGT